MAYKFNPLSGQLEDQSQGVQGPTGTVTAATDGGNDSPGIAFSQESNTGFYRIGSGTIGVTCTGKTSLRIDDSGRLSIVPSTGTGTAIIQPLTSLHNKGLSLYGGINQTNENGSVITLNGKNADNGDLKLFGSNPTSGTAGNIQCWTGGNQNLTIDNTGKVGIGTTTPDSLLHIRNGGNNPSSIIRLESIGTNPNSGDTLGKIEFEHNKTGAAGVATEILSIVDTNNTGGAGFQFKTGTGGAATTKLTIDSSGAVGIGTIPAATSSNTKRLALGAKASIWGRTSDNVDGALTLADNYYVNSAGTNKIIESGAAAYLNLRDGSLTFGTTDTTYSAGDTVGLTEKFRIQNDGKVGIGTHNPYSVLHIKETTTANAKKDIFTCESSSGGFAIQASNTSDSNPDWRLRTYSGEDIVFAQGSDGTTERARFKTDGTTAFEGSLQVKGHGNISSGSHNYYYGRGSNSAGISIYGEESAIELVATDTSQHAGSLLFRHHNNKGFGFVHNGTSEELELKAFTSSDNDFSLHGAGSQVSSLVTVLTAASDGDVTFKGDINATGAEDVRLTLGSTGDVGSNTSVYVAADGSDLNFNAGLNGDTYFSSGITSTVSILSSGKVGIGTTTPEADLQVVGQGFFTSGETDPGDSGRLVVEGNKGYADSATTLATSTTKSVLRVKGSNNSSDSLWIGTLANGDFGHHDPYIQGANGNGSAAKDIAIQPYDGNVGIGTDSTVSKLHLHEDSSNANWLRITNSSTTDNEGVATAENGLMVGLSGTEDAYILHKENKNIHFETANTHVMTISSDQKVGIGTNTPTRLVTIENNSSTAYDAGPGTGESVYTNGSVLRLHNKNGNDNTGVNNQVGLEMFVASGATSYGLLTFVRTGNYIGDLTYKSRLSSNGNYAEYLRIKSDGDVEIKQGDVSLATNKELKFGDGNFKLWRSSNSNNYINSPSNNSLIIQAQGNTALEIKSDKSAVFSGNVNLGTTNTAQVNVGTTADALGVDSRDNSGINLVGTGRMYLKSSDHSEFAAIGGGEIIRFRYAYTDGTNPPGSNSGTGTPASIAGEIVVSGTTTVSYNTESDYRLKENEVAISDGITRLKLLKPYRFNFKAEPDKTVDGFFAHEVTPSVPEAITGEKDDPDRMQGIDQSKLVPLLTAALQEAIAKIETLETKVAALESS